MALGSAVVLLDASLASGSPDLGCSSPDAWAASSTCGRLRNAGLLTPDSVYFSKTRVELLAQQQIGNDLHRQVHEIEYTLTSGAVVRAVAISDASSEECSMSSVEVRVIGQAFGTYP